MKARNIYAVLASKRKAGSHRKSNKALRKKQKHSRYDETGYHIRLLPELSEFKSQCLDQFILKHINLRYSYKDWSLCYATPNRAR